MCNLDRNRSIVKIFKNIDDELVFKGMGVLINEKHIITCSHIFRIPEEREAKTLEDVIIIFPSALEKAIPARIICDSDDENIDIAVIELTETRPHGTEIAQLFTLKNTAFMHHNVDILGYPEGFENGVYTYYKMQDWLPNQRIQIAKRLEAKIEISKGFSGAPVWNENSDGAIGIVSKADPTDGLAEVITFDFILTKLSGACQNLIPDLREPNDSLKGKICLEFSRLIKYLDYKSGKSFIRVTRMRNKLVELNILEEEDIIEINKITNIVINEWETTRNKFYWMEENAYKYLFNFAEFDDIHCVLLEEKLYEVVFEDNINNLIKTNNLPRPLERDDLVILLAACWLHDIGMIPENLPGDAKLKGNKDEYFIKDVFKKILKSHHVRTSQFINYNANRLTGFNISDLKKLCEFHRHKEYISVHKERLDFEKDNADSNRNIALLASYLRLAGAIQVPRKTETKGFVPLGFDDPYSTFQWLKSQCVEESVIRREKHVIEIDIKIPAELRNDENIEILKSSLQIEIQNEVDFTRDIFIKNNKEFYLIAECKTVEVPMNEDERKEFAELLANIKLLYVFSWLVLPLAFGDYPVLSVPMLPVLS